MVHPDSRLFRPVMYMRGAFIALLLVTYTILWYTWQSLPEATEFWQFAIMVGILAAVALLSSIIYVALTPRRNALVVHLCLLIDTVATTGLIMCTGYAGSFVHLFYLLIVLAAGVLYGYSTAIKYFVLVSLANIAALVLDLVEPLNRAAPRPTMIKHVMTATLPVMAIPIPLLLVFRLTQRGRYLETLYESIGDGLVILDDDGAIVEANVRVSDMTGAPRHELVGTSLESLVTVSDDGVRRVQEQLKRCFAGDAVSFEVSLVRRRGEPLPVEIRAQSVAGLSPGRVQAFVRDISARRLMEAEIRRQNDELRRINQELQVGRDVALNASRLKTQFLANMSHELRTPLNSIIGYTQFVLDDRARPLDDDQREDLDRVLRSARHLLELINGVLDLARIESGRESVSISRFALADLVDSVVDSVTPMAKSKGLTVNCRVAPGLPELQTDEKKLRQILLNLLANAVKFTERGGVRVDASRDGTDFVRVSVSDTGIGIPSEQLDEIFNEFHQVDPSIHKQYGGTGLGLAIVKRLVELLKGAIQVESAAGKGSTFVISVPLTLSLAHDAAGSMTVVPVRSERAATEPPGQIVVFPDATPSVAAES